MRPIALLLHLDARPTRRLCRSAAGFWTLFDDRPQSRERPRALPPGPCEALLNADRLGAVETTPSGAIVYSLAHEPEAAHGPDRPPSLKRRAPSPTYPLTTPCP